MFKFCNSARRGLFSDVHRLDLVLWGTLVAPRFSRRSACKVELLEQAISLVNYMLDEHPLDVQLWREIPPRQLEEKMSNLSVRFCRIAHCDACHTKNASGHTIRGRGVKAIDLNSTLQQRYSKYGVGAVERTRILFFLGVSLYHELAHVLLRWNGSMSSPSCYIGEDGLPEVGYFSERRAWGGFVHIELDISGSVHGSSSRKRKRQRYICCML